jgi:predicted MFS family arabinose efflux permease
VDRTGRLVRLGERRNLAPQRLNRLGALREREFRLLFTGRLISFMGGAIAPIALAFAVLDLTGSRSDLGIVLAAQTVPMIAFVLVGGAIADRLPRNAVMVGSNLVNGGVQAATALLLLTHEARIWHLAVLQFVAGISRAFFFPASQGIVPQTVPAALLQEANTVLRLALNATNILGAAVGGFLVAGVGPGWAIAFDSMTFFAAAVTLRLMRLERSERMPGSSFVGEILEGWREFSSRTWLWVVVVAFAFINACSSGGVNVLGAAVAKFELGGAGSFGLIVAGESIGLVLGGLLMLRWRPNRLLLAGCTATIAMAPPLVLFAAFPHTLLIALAGVVAGFGVEIFGVCWDTAVQQHIPQRALSRVYAYDMLGSIIFIPVGLSVAGPVADAIGQDATLYGFAGVMAAACVLMLASRDIRTMTRTG